MTRLLQDETQTHDSDHDMDDAYEDFDEPVCERCHGDGMDPWNDYLFPCPECQGEQHPEGGM